MKFAISIFNNYYYLFLLLGIASFINVNGFDSLVALLTVVGFFLLIVTRKEPFRPTNGDFFVICFFLYQLLSVFFLSYSTYLWYCSIKLQIIPMIFYYLGRQAKFTDNEILERMKGPMVFAMLVGLILYFWQPGWYLERRLATLSADASERMYYEATRLSSFWPWSYAMGYGSLFYLMFFIKDLFVGKVNLINVIFIVIALLTCFFAQQRVSIAFFFVFLSMLTLFNTYNNKKQLLALWCILALAIVAIIVYILHFADSELLTYMMNRSFDSEDNLVDERFGMFDVFLKVTLFGHGMGSCGHMAVYLLGKGSADCEYIRMLYELGLIGCILLFFIFLNGIFIAYRKRKYYIFELSILLFWLASMIGATPFENAAMQPFLFWYCLGRVNNLKLVPRRKKKIQPLYNDYSCKIAVPQ